MKWSTVNGPFNDEFPSTIQSNHFFTVWAPKTSAINSCVSMWSKLHHFPRRHTAANDTVTLCALASHHNSTTNCSRRSSSSPSMQTKRLKNSGATRHDPQVSTWIVLSIHYCWARCDQSTFWPPPFLPRETANNGRKAERVTRINTPRSVQGKCTFFRATLQSIPTTMATKISDIPRDITE